MLFGTAFPRDQCPISSKQPKSFSFSRVLSSRLDTDTETHIHRHTRRLTQLLVCEIIPNYFDFICVRSIRKRQDTIVPLPGTVNLISIFNLAWIPRLNRGSIYMRDLCICLSFGFPNNLNLASSIEIFAK